MSKLSPGERAINWAKALSIICTALVGLLGYTNWDHIAPAIGLAEADGKTEISADQANWIAVEKFSAETRAEIVRLEAAIKSVSKEENADVQRLNEILKDMQEQIDRWHPQ